MIKSSVASDCGFAGIVANEPANLIAAADCAVSNFAAVDFAIVTITANKSANIIVTADCAAGNCAAADGAVIIVANEPANIIAA